MAVKNQPARHTERAFRLSGHHNLSMAQHSLPLRFSHFGDLVALHLGPLDVGPVVLMLGRNNVDKRSNSIEAMLLSLHQMGLTVCWYERRGQWLASLREAALARVRHAWLDRLDASLPVAAAVATKAVRLCLKIRYPKRHGFIFKKLPLVSDHAEDLRRFMRQLPAQEVFIVSHSAGGIKAASLADEPAVKKLVCFGYPFKHPDKPDEAYRTARLAAIGKPFLVIQGNRDEYGCARDAARYKLSPSIVVAPIDTDHDYDALDESLFGEVLQLLQHFLLQSPPLGHRASGQQSQSRCIF